MNNLQAIPLSQQDRATWTIGFLCLLVYAGCFAFPLMDKDAAHHANIALHMLQFDDYTSLVDRQKDYLDKPHLLFWSSALSFKIFGVNTFAHRLPALLYALLSIYSTYRLTLHLSDKSTARLAAIMLGTAQGFMLSIDDARMETPLAAGIIFGLWQLLVYVDTRRWLHLVLGALGAAIAFSTKGWVGPAIIFVSLFFYIWLQGKWSVLWSPKTWLIVPFFFLLISPVIYAYYLQFDLHPEKKIRGMRNISGIRFILWDQNFERFDGDSFKKGGRNSNYFFLYHTFIWAFFPWSIIAYVALVAWIRRLVKKGVKAEPLSFAAVSFGFFLFMISWSNFKMPHYIFWFLPLAALFTAPFLRQWISSAKTSAVLYYLHVFFALLVLAATVLLNYYFFKPMNAWVWIVGSSLLVGLLYLLFRKCESRDLKLVYITAGFSIVFNFFVNYNFYPNLFRYQGGNELVNVIEEKDLKIPDESIQLIDDGAHSFDFYRGYNHAMADTNNLPRGNDNLYFLLTSRHANRLIQRGFRIDTVASHADYNVSTLKLKFLNPKTRPATLDTIMLARLY